MTIPIVRGCLRAAGAMGEGHCGVAAGDSRLNREGQLVRRPDRQGTDAAYLLDAPPPRHRALGRTDNRRQEGPAIPCITAERALRHRLPAQGSSKAGQFGELVLDKPNAERCRLEFPCAARLQPVDVANGRTDLRAAVVV